MLRGSDGCGDDVPRRADEGGGLWTCVAFVSRVGWLIRPRLLTLPLPAVVPVDTVHAMMAHVNAGDRPLALYPFSNNAALAEKIHMTCISGGVTINDVMFHGASDSAPFGGVGASGSGCFRGRVGARVLTMCSGIPSW